MLDCKKDIFVGFFFKCAVLKFESDTESHESDRLLLLPSDQCLAHEGSIMWLNSEVTSDRLQVFVLSSLHRQKSTFILTLLRLLASNVSCSETFSPGGVGMRVSALDRT